jgi:uncharacterized Ntn-hydrolase superfamily protein
MTWSIIARDEATGRVGIAVATKFFAVGATVPYIKSGVGAVATQAFVNPFFGPRGLALLATGASAEDAVRMLAVADEGRDNRQVHVMDKQGHFAAHTGAKCIDWSGHLVKGSCSVAGNMLAGPRVIEDTAATYEDNSDVPFARRLINAMMVGERAGGDKRGKQSAALLIHGEEEYPLLDLRVDDHVDPLVELQRLEAVARERWVHFRRLIPSKSSPYGLIDRSDLEAKIEASIAEGYE